MKQLKIVNTVCPRSSDPFYITYYLKWVTTSWTDGIFVLFFDSYKYILKTKVDFRGLCIVYVPTDPQQSTLVPAAAIHHNLPAVIFIVFGWKTNYIAFCRGNCMITVCNTGSFSMVRNFSLFRSWCIYVYKSFFWYIGKQHLYYVIYHQN